jgi:WD40 repeat protein
MFSTSQVEYHFNHPYRCICCAKSASNSNGFISTNEFGDHHNNMSFFVGSCWLPNKGSNVVKRMKYDDDLCELLLDASFTHLSLGDIHQLSACPLYDSMSLPNNRILTTHRSTSIETNHSMMMDTVVWQLPPESNLGATVDDEDDALIEPQILEELLNFSNLQGSSNEPDYTISSAAWHSHRENHIITSSYSGEIKLWDLHTQQTCGEWNIHEISTCRNATSRRIVCDPHDPNRIAIANGCDIVFLDTRSTATSAMVLKGCHRYGITDFDANPNRPFVYVTAGQDSFIKFHDVRQIVTSSHSTSSPLLKMIKGGHTHWVSTIRFNPYHDQLLVSTGTDSAVNLWRISSISSAPILEVSEEATFTGKLGSSGTTDDDEYYTLSQSRDSASGPHVDTTAPDINVQKYEHQESVYGMTWIDPWCYVSLSYDGHVVLHHVPSKEKYKILL